MSGSPENYKGQYAGLKFPSYKYNEYPKILYKDEAKKLVLGTANNAMEEKELYASIGVEKADIDPLNAALDEVSVLRAKLAQYEGDDVALQKAAPKRAGVQTNTVEMLPAGSGPGNDLPGENTTPAHLEESPRGANPTYNPPPGGDPAVVQRTVPKAGENPTHNNLAAQAIGTGDSKQQQSVSTGVQGKVANPLLAGKPGAQGSAPQVTSPIKSGT